MALAKKGTGKEINLEVVHSDDFRRVFDTTSTLLIDIANYLEFVTEEFPDTTESRVEAALKLQSARLSIYLEEIGRWTILHGTYRDGSATKERVIEERPTVPLPDAPHFDDRELLPQGLLELIVRFEILHRAAIEIERKISPPTYH